MENKTWANHPTAHIVHAKKLGTNLTACGLDSGSWYRYWQPFLKACFGRACDQCYQAISLGDRSSTPVASIDS